MLDRRHTPLRAAAERVKLDMHRRAMQFKASAHHTVDAPLRAVSSRCDCCLLISDLFVWQPAPSSLSSLSSLPLIGLGSLSQWADRRLWSGLMDPLSSLLPLPPISVPEGGSPEVANC